MGQVMAVGAACALLYFAGEGIVKADRWVVKKTKDGMHKVFHKRQAKPAVIKP